MHKLASSTVSLIAAILSWSLTSPVFAQSVLVDQAGANQGNLTTGAILFGGSEPSDLPICLVGPIILGDPSPARASCPVSTMEGIVSARTIGHPQIAGEPVRTPLNQYGLDFYTDNAPRLSITHNGQIGIGTQSPLYTVQIQRRGDVQIALGSSDTGGKLWSIQSSGTVDSTKVGTFQIIDRDQNVQRLGIDNQGLVSVKSLQITGGADLAEPFKTTMRLRPGSLVVIDPRQAGSLLASTRAYDRRVAGVVSGANDIQPGVSLEQFDGGEGKQQVALSGRVYAIADTSNGSIRPGDLLTTSGHATHAMKATNFKKAQGAIIGKAMSSLKTGEGYVLVLVSLQ